MGGVRVRWWPPFRRAEPERALTTLDDYADALNSFVYQGNTYGLGGLGVHQTQTGQRAEPIPNDLTGYAQAGYAGNGVVFAVMLVRMLVFSGIRFSFQRLASSRPSELFGTQELALLERPWVGGTTQDLLIRTIQDADLAGNAYWTRTGGELVRLRPDWVQIVLEPRMLRGGVLGWRKFGYLYTEGGPGSADPVPLLPDEVAHFAPHPDPLATYRGMSWLTPVLREIRGDAQMSRYKQQFFENAATPNLVVKMPQLDVDKFKRFKAAMDEEHAGVDNAYKTLYLGGGADVSVVGQSFEQMTFSEVGSVGETRIAAAGGVPPVIAGLTKGLESSTYSNYGQARRRLADATCHPLWLNASGSFSPLVITPRGARLHYDTRDVPFLREDAKDSAEIAQMQAATMASLVQAGYTPESVQRAVLSGDYGLLEHSGLYSVQLQPAGAQTNPALNGSGQRRELIHVRGPDHARAVLLDLRDGFHEGHERQ